MSCDASSNNVVSNLEKWNQAKTGGQDASPYEKEIAHLLQQEYTLLSSQAMNSDPNRLNEVREKVNADLARQSANCNMPAMELVEQNGELIVTTSTGKRGFNVKIDEYQDWLAFTPQQATAKAQSAANMALQVTRFGDAPQAITVDAQQKPCEPPATQSDSRGTTSSDTRPPVAPRKVMPKYIPGERPIAGDDKVPQNDLHPIMERDHRNNMVYKFKDGSSVKFDQEQPPRVRELTNTRGERISLSYRGSATSPSGFIMTDKNGSVMESGFKGLHDREWNVDTHGASWKVKEIFRGARITDVGVTEDFQLCMRDRSGNFLEQRRDGDVLKRDSRGRVTSEVTSVDRTTSFSYRGKETVPTTYTIEDGGGALIEHGVRKENAWKVYRPKQGTTSMHPDDLTNADNLVRNPADKVTSLRVNHRNGNAVMVHSNGDRSWRPSDDERLWRKTTGGAETIVHPRDNGKPEMQHFVSPDGVKTRYQYDDRGQVLRISEHKPNGEVIKLSRADVSQDFVDQDGRRQKIEATHMADGSVRVNWLERNSQIVQRPDGSEVHEFMAKDGRRRVHSTVDTAGTRTEFDYNTATGEPVRMTI
ncbi:MAG: hypothetical protein C0507_15760, partial [Cyanobacteria bacterium PR.3.49]|nr:hypothetical protein [Cyanobacteria bacterium PR.3.49]